MAAEGFPVARIDEYAKPCEPAIHVLRSVVTLHMLKYYAGYYGPLGFTISLHVDKLLKFCSQQNFIFFLLQSVSSPSSFMLSQHILYLIKHVTKETQT